MLDRFDFSYFRSLIKNGSDRGIVTVIGVDEDVDENSSSSSRRNSTFLNVVALGNVVSDLIYLYLQNEFEFFLSEEKELVF